MTRGILTIHIILGGIRHTGGRSDSHLMSAVRNLLCSAIVAAFAACASGPRYDTARYSTSITPALAVENNAALRDKEVLWGGLLINSINKDDATQLEILAYPLDSTQRPDTDLSPQGRFLAVKSGYLETVDYSEGRLVTVAGKLTETRSGQVGEAAYVYPVVEAESVHLWPKASDAPKTRVQFGIGINVR